MIVNDLSICAINVFVPSQKQEKEGVKTFNTIFSKQPHIFSIQFPLFSIVLAVLCSNKPKKHILPMIAPQRKNQNPTSCPAKRKRTERYRIFQ